MGLIPNQMKNKKKRDDSKQERILERFRGLGLHPETIEQIAGYGDKLKYYHFRDLVNIKNPDRIKNLPVDKQKELIGKLIERRDKIPLNNQQCLAALNLSVDPDSESALLWYENISEKIKEINQLYSRLRHAIDYLDKEQIRKLKNELHKLSIANLNCIIQLRHKSLNKKRV